MHLRRFIETKSLQLHRVAFLSRIFGLCNALRMVLFVGSTNFNRTISLRDSDGSPFSFTFRGRTDQGVLSHLYKDGVRIVDSKSQPIRTILDCGANIGVETLRFRLHHPQAEIIAVEADPDNFALLEANCRDSARISAIHGAVWSKDTELYLHRSMDGNPECSSVGEAGGGPAVKGYSIDRLRMLRGWSQIDILKLDIEGAEHELFSGSVDWLQRVSCLVFEVPDSDKPGTLQLIFERLGGEQWNGMAIGENLVLLRHSLPWSVSRVLGVQQ
jgi:FkbM family methyltransferase